MAVQISAADSVSIFPESPFCVRPWILRVWELQRQTGKGGGNIKKAPHHSRSDRYMTGGPLGAGVQERLIGLFKCV